MNKPKFYRHNPTGEVFIRMETKYAVNCTDGTPLLICLNDGKPYAEPNTFDGDEAEFVEIKDVRIVFSIPAYEVVDQLL